jgi:exodeoxyribonuclease VII small subunit
MTDESYSFTTARARLEEIVAQVRKKDTSLEKSLDLLEEGVRLANACTEQIDHADWGGTAAAAAEPGVDGGTEAGLSGQAGDASNAAFAEATAAAVGLDTAAPDAETVVVEGVAIIEDTEIVDEDGAVVAEVLEVVEYEAVTEFVDADEAWAEEFTDEPLEPEDPSADER